MQQSKELDRFIEDIVIDESDSMLELIVLFESWPKYRFSFKLRLLLWFILICVQSAYEAITKQVLKIDADCF